MGRPPRRRTTPRQLDDQLRRLERYSLLVVDEIGYLPLERQAANLLFALVARLAGGKAGGKVLSGVLSFRDVP